MQAELGFVTGGKDGLVKLWSCSSASSSATDSSSGLQGGDCYLRKEFPMLKSIPLPCSPSIYSVCCNRDMTKIVVGMKGGEIYELGVTSGKSRLVTEGHYNNNQNTGLLGGLASHPTKPDQYVTCGDDGVLKLWSIAAKRVIARVRLDGAARALAWSSSSTTTDGSSSSSLLAVGFGGGSTAGGEGGGGGGGGASSSSKDGAFMLLDEKVGSSAPLNFHHVLCMVLTLPTYLPTCS